MAESSQRWVLGIVYNRATKEDKYEIAKNPYLYDKLISTRNLAMHSDGEDDNYEDSDWSDEDD